MCRTWQPTALYAFAHFSVDLGCAYAMFARYQGSPLGFLLYNFFAFAMQMPLGVLADWLGHNRRFALLGSFLVGAMCCFPAFGIPGCVILGLSNSLFHIGGGLDVLNLSGRRAAPLGVFVSPGAYGVFLGTLWGNRSGSVYPILTALLLGFVGMLLWKKEDMPENSPVVFPDRTICPVAALLFLVVVLRSYGGLSGTFPWKTGVWSVLAVSAVVLGKTAGGFLSDHFRLHRAAGVTLALAAVLFLLGNHPIAGVLALFFFNMTMPMTLFALARRMPGCKGFSFGLLTFALFLGFLPTYFGIGTIDHIGMSIVTAVSALLLLPAVCSRKAVKKL